MRGRENRILNPEEGHGRKSLNAERREVGERARWEVWGGALKEHVLGGLPLPVSLLLLNSRAL